VAAPATLTITMQDGSSTVALTIPSQLTPTQYINSILLAGGVWDLMNHDTVAGATFWPVRYFKKLVTS
jgi:hypothetical protein